MAAEPNTAVISPCHPLVPAALPLSWDMGSPAGPASPGQVRKLSFSGGKPMQNAPHSHKKASFPLFPSSDKSRYHHEPDGAAVSIYKPQ